MTEIWGVHFHLEIQQKVKSMTLTEAGSDEPLCPYLS